MEVAIHKCSLKKLFLKILQNSQQNTCAAVSFYMKFQPRSSRPEVFCKKGVLRNFA